MNRHLAFVVYGAKGVAWLVGVVSSIGAAFFGWGALALHVEAMPPASSSGNSAIDLLVGAARILAGAFVFFAKAGHFLFTVIAVFCTALLLFSVLVWLVANGLAAHHTWARVLAMLVGSMILPACILALISGPRGGASVATFMLAAASAYLVWVLWRRFV